MNGSQQRLLLAEACRRNFYLFASIAFGIRFYCDSRPDDNWFIPRVHKPLCDWLQANVEEWEATRRYGERASKKLLICIPRGFGKSTLVTAAFNLWLHTRNPELVTAISSYDESKSADFLRVIQSVMEGRSGFGLFKDLFPGWAPVGDEAVWRKEACTHTARRNRSLRDPSFFTTSVSIGLTGYRPDVFCLDDPIVEEKITKEANWVEKAKKHLDAVRPAVKTNGLWVVCLTRYRDGDVASKAMLDEGVAEFAPTGMRPRDDDYIEDGPWNVFFISARDATGIPTLPEVWPDSELLEYEKRDPAGFAAQMMNMPAEGKHMPVRREHIEALWIRRDDVPTRLRYSMHLDTAFKDATKVAKGDYSTIQIWGHHTDGSGKVVYLDGYRSRDCGIVQYTDVLVEMLRTLYPAKWPFVVTDDKETGGHAGAYAEFLRGACYRAGLPMPFYLQIHRGGQRKEGRIRTAAYAWVSGKVQLLREAREVKPLVDEMLRIGISVHDDMADPASDVFHPDVYTTDRSAGDAPKIEDRPYDALMRVNPAEWTDNEFATVYDHSEELPTEWRPWPGMEDH